MEKVQIKDNHALKRDMFSKAVINTSVSGYHNRLKQKTLQQEKDNEIEELKSDVQEIKSLLKELLGKK